MRVKYGFEIRWVLPVEGTWHQIGSEYDTVHEAAMLLAICLEIAFNSFSAVEGRIIKIILPDDIIPSEFSRIQILQ